MAETPRLMESCLEALRRADVVSGDIHGHFLIPEAAVVEELVRELRRYDVDAALVAREAQELAAEARERILGHLAIDTFLKEYSLSTDEGVLLMCLAEALLRIPDDATARLLIRDKLSEAHWETHLGRSDSVLVNASTWGLLLTGRLFKSENVMTYGDVRNLIGRLGEGLALKAIRQAMTMLGQHFVISEDIAHALRNARRDSLYSFDMLGEGAVSEQQAEVYFKSYLDAIEAIGKHYRGGRPLTAAISIKLSALHSRFEPLQFGRAREVLTERASSLLEAARDHQVQVTIDAEESHRLHLTLAIFKDLCESKTAAGWNGLGIAVQTYLKRALPVLDWLENLARDQDRSIPVRLVKGAYWDSEIKRAQQLGLEDYPVHVRKAATDVAYLAAAHRIFATRGALYGQFATHNAHTLAAVARYARHHGVHDYEIQRLYGMGGAIADVVAQRWPEMPQRIYAPVGQYETLLPYLMRRLIENGANSSFIHHLGNDEIPIDAIVRDPLTMLEERLGQGPSQIPLPEALYGEGRLNAPGVNIDDESVLRETLERIWEESREIDMDVLPGRTVEGAALRPEPIHSPADLGFLMGHVRFADAAHCQAAIDVLHAAFPRWQATPIEERAHLLERIAELLLEEQQKLLGLIMLETGRTLPAALAEVREAVDFCRYYAKLATDALAVRELPGTTGESNFYYRQGRGTFACISPWNFPLAIFVGQIAAALVAGNTVLAKPSELANLTATHCIDLMHRAGIPESVLVLLPARGEDVARHVLADERIKGVAFTGGTRTGKAIQRRLAERDGEIIPLVAETGGQNAMITDSSGLTEQIVKDVLVSAFDSAGQRCSSLRTLFVQDDVAEHVLGNLEGALAMLKVGHPLDPATDVGPVISGGAKREVERHLADMEAVAKRILRAPEPDNAVNGHYVAPAIVELEDIALPEREIFGPVLHVIRYAESDFDQVIEAVKATGYALTLGVHSRIQHRIDEVERRIRVGNLYVNRNMIGAVVGSQPFGGFGLSGTGPKAGGPDYLMPFTIERATTHNTTAVGGDTQLLSLNE